MSRRFWVSVLSALLVLLPLPVPAQVLAAGGLSAHKAAAVDQAMRAEMESQKVTGLAIGVIQNGRIVYVKGYGMADEKNRIPVTERTLFRWASISKTLTAVAAMQLFEKKQLDLQADIRDYVPEFPNKGTPITARQLLSHQSGIVHYANGPVVRTKASYDAEHPFEDVVTALDMFKESPLVNAPGTKYSYSSHGFILLSAVVQRAGRQKFADQVQERIARPLGMETLQPDYQWKSIPGRAIGYRKIGTKIVPSSDTDVSWKLGGGGFLSTIEDLARFAAGLMQRRLVNSSTEALMWQPQRTAVGDATSYGLGFHVDAPANGRLRVSHNGDQEKSSCRMVLYPRERHGVVVFSNCEYADPGAFSTAVYQALARR